MKVACAIIILSVIAVGSIFLANHLRASDEYRNLGLVK